MSQLSNAELAQIRADCATLFPDTCTILSVVRTSDGAGGWTSTTETISENVPCRLDFPDPGDEGLAAGSNVPFKNGIVSMAYDEVVTTANQLLINDVVYNITGVNTGQSWIGVKRVAVEKVP